MGSLFRSEEMILCQIFLQSEAAYTCVSELGELGLIQFRDLNAEVNAQKKKFVNEVRRCDEMERQLRYLENEIRKESIPMLDTGDNPEAPSPREMADLEATLEKVENETREVDTNSVALKQNFFELTELKHVLHVAQNFLGGTVTDTDDAVCLLPEDFSSRGQTPSLGFVTGMIARERIPGFEQMLWRACRGNVFLKQAEIKVPLENPVTGDNVYKSVFIIFFQGDQLRTRVKKICEGFRATIYPCPETPTERHEMAIGLMTRIEDLKIMLGQTMDHSRRMLVAVAANIRVWFIKVRKIKAIYHTLNMFNPEVTQECFIAECWCAVTDLDKIQFALRRGTERSGSSVPSILNQMQTKDAPPTFHRINKFTAVFQAIVDAYGIASYREVNPAPFAIVTFPFLFSVMFGDIGHGSIMFLFGLWMVLSEKSLLAKKIDNEIWNMCFGGRYVILMMGAFSIYSGFLYNDIFSKAVNIFGSDWDPSRLCAIAISPTREKTFPFDPNTTDIKGTPYPFGIDPIWQMADNKIIFEDSFKMKLAIILGVTHMLSGVMLSLFNYGYFRNILNIFCQFIPELIFLLSLFGYLCFLIIYKWLMFDATNAGCAPSLLIGLINMFLMTYPSEPCSAHTFYDHQQIVQMVLLGLAVVCIPWMLIIKPVILRQQHFHKIKSHRPPSPSSPTVGLLDPDIQYDPMAAMSDGPKSDGPETEFDFGELLVHQAIHTIEYCLGCISHTASYLRLWALSLAHAELSEVLWNMLFRIGLKFKGYPGAAGAFIMFAPWAVLTIGVLLIMEGLSAFLHTLRLHWVEFMSKFYKGEGYMFMPFSFDNMMDVTTKQ